MKFSLQKIALYNCILGLFFSTCAYSLPGLNPKFFAEAYDETVNFEREGNNTITAGHLIQGVKFPELGLVKSAEFYFKQRYGSDANKDYWNNRGELITGTRIRFFSKIYVAVFYEYIRGWYMGDNNTNNPNPYGDTYEDMRYGFIFWQGLDNEYKKKWKTNIPLSFWDEIYADAVRYKRDDNNFASYTNIRAGERLVRVGKMAFDVYGAFYYAWDTNKDYWNNKFEYGLGFRLKPWSDLDLSLFYETLDGQYLKRKGRYPLHHGLNYSDHRFGILFWYGLGF